MYNIRGDRYLLAWVVCGVKERLYVLLLIITVSLVVGCVQDEPLVPVDGPAEPPMVTGVLPLSGSVVTDVKTSVKVFFSEPMDRESTAAALRVEPALPLDLSWQDDRTLVIRPAEAWEVGTEYRFLLGQEARGVRGAALDAPFRWSMRVDSGYLMVLSTAPAAGSVDVPLDQVLYVEFNGVLAPGEPEEYVHIWPERDGELTVDGDTLIFRPRQGWLPGTTYSVLIAGGELPGPRDEAGRTLMESFQFQFTTENRTSIWRVDPADGSEEEVLTVGMQVADIAASPAGERLLVLTRERTAWTSDTVGFTGQLWVISLVDGSKRRVAPELVWSQSNDLARAWSPDGVKLAYAEGTSPDESRIWIVDSETGERTAVELLDASLKAANPVWMPGGEGLVYRLWGDWQSHIVVYQEGVSRELATFPIRASEYFFRGLSVSPDSSFIISEEETPAGDSLALYRVDMQTGDYRELVRGYRHAWSPDGRFLAYVADGVFLYDLVEEKVEMIAILPESVSVRWGPEWSPDGSYLSYALVRAGRDEFGDGVWLFDLTEDRLRRITDLPCTGGVTWTPDGSLLVASYPNLERP